MKTSSEPWLIIFVKAPVPGHVKTRLAGLLSPEQSAELYRCLVADTLAVSARLRARTVVAYAAHPELPDTRWLGPQPAFSQRGASLGQRLAHAFDWAFQQGARHVFALGSDAPELSAGWIRSAIRQLNQTDVVLGPTRDGGYHLIGLKRPQPALFVNMPWSSPQLFGRTLNTIQRLGLGVRCLPAIRDLDTPEDLQALLGSAEFLQRHTHTAALLRNTKDLLASVMSEADSS